MDWLPVELAESIFLLLVSATDYSNLSSTCRKLYGIGSNSLLRTKFLKKYFLAHLSTLYVEDELTVICRFIEASGVKPCSKDPSLVAEQIPTSHFVSYALNDVSAKRIVLDLFRSRCLTQSWTIPTLGNHVLARAKQATRHMTRHTGPRRVYYDVTINSTRFYCVFFDLDMVTAFKDDEKLSAHKGTVLYEDEGIISTAACDKLIKATKTEINNMPFDSITTIRRNGRPYPLGWKPSLLRTFVDCTLLQPIRKGGMSAGEKYAVVFMYEHQEDDTICLEFCELFGQDLRPRGFLLLAEYDIIWSV
ncbi:hypothetical protein EC973_005009 [Apophysomyces ossiformis]|uniref:F-box domain-containing protein n=1 Tax=Apophysomyces ossiformis TaxID=679940 RepID=A0A8H7BFB5_9FUNG|nr:hypothetical protein EC973_005009 [Apophysomyces ossiformis]